jgi:hypothetical protein
VNKQYVQSKTQQPFYSTVAAVGCNIITTNRHNKHITINVMGEWGVNTELMVSYFRVDMKQPNQVPKIIHSTKNGCEDFFITF